MSRSNRSKGYKGVKKSAAGKPKVKGSSVRVGKTKPMSKAQLAKVNNIIFGTKPMQSTNPFDEEKDRAYWDSMALIGAVLVAAVGSVVVAVVLLSKIVGQ